MWKYLYSFFSPLAASSKGPPAGEVYSPVSVFLAFLACEFIGFVAEGLVCACPPLLVLTIRISVWGCGDVSFAVSDCVQSHVPSSSEGQSARSGELDATAGGVAAEGTRPGDWTCLLRVNSFSPILFYFAFPCTHFLVRRVISC